jgi:cell division protein FtsZ
MANKGLALMGTGIAEGADRAVKAATEAISSPLLEDITIDGATGIIINITGNNTLTTSETNEAMTLIMEAADEDAEIIFGTVIDDNMNDSIKVTVIATGLGGVEREETISSTRPTPSVSEVSMRTPSPIAEPIKEEVIPVEMTNTRTEVTEISEDEIEPNHSTSMDEFLAAEETEAEETSSEVSPSVRSRLTESIKAAASNYEASKTDNFEERETRSPEERSTQATAKEKSRAQAIAEKLGFMNFDEDEFDTPSYLRKDTPEV